MFALRERRVHVTQARTRPPPQPVRGMSLSTTAESAALRMGGPQSPIPEAASLPGKHFWLRDRACASLQSPNPYKRHMCARAQEDFEMAVAKVMKKDSEKNVSLKKLWK